MDVADAAAAVSREQGDASQPESTADPEQPGEEIEEIDELDSEPNSVLGRLKQPLDGSITEDRVGELWNPDLGGLNRVILVIEESLGIGDGLPRAAHGVIGLIEMADEPPEVLESLSDGEPDPSEESSEEIEESEPSTSSRADTQEVINYDG